MGWAVSQTRRAGGPNWRRLAPPNLDQLAAQSACGFTVPVAPAVTPGSGPGHLALFGYDPLAYNIGRGVLEATGIDFDLQLSDIAARGNFCSLDDDVITDRRAGRISTELCAELCRKLSDIELPNVDLFVEPVREHRLVLILRGSGLSEDIWGTDPLGEGSPPLAARASSESGGMDCGLGQQILRRGKKRDWRVTHLPTWCYFEASPSAPTGLL